MQRNKRTVSGYKMSIKLNIRFNRKKKKMELYQCIHFKFGISHVTNAWNVANRSTNIHDKVNICIL